MYWKAHYSFINFFIFDGAKFSILILHADTREVYGYSVIE